MRIVPGADTHREIKGPAFHFIVPSLSHCFFWPKCPATLLALRQVVANPMSGSSSASASHRDSSIVSWFRCHRTYYHLSAGASNSGTQVSDHHPNCDRRRSFSDCDPASCPYFGGLLLRLGQLFCILFLQLAGANRDSYNADQHVCTDSNRPDDAPPLISPDATDAE